MQVKIIQIGNSKGLRLSKTILDRYEIEDNVDIVMKDDHIEIHPKSKPRQAWAKQFKVMNKRGDDDLIIPDVFEDED